MSLALLERAKHPAYLFFDTTRFDVIDHQRRPWLLPEQIGKALGMADPRKTVKRLYHRHHDEFGPDETAEIELEFEVGGGDRGGQNDPLYRPKRALHTQRHKARIFSLRGAYHLGFFAQTEIAKRFRQWVLDLIEQRGNALSFYTAYSQLLEYEFEKHPRWREVHSLLYVGEPTASIARRLECAPSTVRRALREMRKAGIVSEQEYTRWTENAREYTRLLRQVRADDAHP